MKDDNDTQHLITLIYFLAGGTVLFVCVFNWLIKGT